MRRYFLTGYLLIVAGCIISLCTGCTGIEAGGKLWITRVDERQESQRTHNVPLKCYLWSDCTKSNEAQGS